MIFSRGIPLLDCKQVQEECDWVDSEFFARQGSAIKKQRFREVSGKVAEQEAPGTYVYTQTTIALVESTQCNYSVTLESSNIQGKA